MWWFNLVHAPLTLKDMVWHLIPFPSQASDRAFKQELAKLVDMRVWEAAKEASRRELGGR